MVCYFALLLSLMVSHTFSSFPPSLTSLPPCNSDYPAIPILGPGSEINSIGSHEVWTILSPLELVFGLELSLA
jgi:hypothetical protein